MFKVLQVSTGYTDGSIERDIIQAAGGTHTLIGSENEDDIIKAGQDADGLLVALTKVTRRIINSLPNLKIIVRAGIGVDNIDLEAAKERNIIVCNLPHYCQDEVADHTVTLLLAIERKIVNQVNDMKNGKWNSPSVYNPIYGLKDHIVGFIGCGGIAQKVIARLKPFGLNFIAFDPYMKSEKAQELGVELKSFDEVIAQSDYISVHSPLTDETFHLINEQAFAKMKPNVYIINTARGGLIDTDALYNAIKNNKIAGAALDVVEDDNEGAKRFSEFDNVIITPHTAYYSFIANRNIKTQAGEVFAKFIRGEKVVSLV